MSQSFEQQVANAALALKSAEELRVLVCAERSEKAALQTRVAELEADQRRHLEAIASEARCLGHLRTNLDEKQARIAELERELAAARDASNQAALCFQTEKLELLAGCKALRAAIDASAEYLRTTTELDADLMGRRVLAMLTLGAAQKAGG